MSAPLPHRPPPVALSALVLALLGAAPPARDPVPRPAETPVAVIVSGRTSTLKRITIRHVGQHIPRTFSGQRVRNTPGFSWYVSRHYALKTDFPAARARHYLTLLELAFPHYVELFGRPLRGLDRKRMAVVYGSSARQLARALASDGIRWNFAGGGITYEGFNAAYQYPSGGLQYHLRYILLHECAHLYQTCLNGTVFNMPWWYYEGVADAVSNHVWEQARQRLTVNVVDKATANNYYDEALRHFGRARFTPSTVHRKGVSGRDAGFLLVNYFSTDVERWLKFRIWRDELFRLNLYNKYQERSNSLFVALFGSWAKLDADFVRWVKARRASFHYVEWGWEQDGDTLLSYGYPNKGTHSQTDLLVRPGEKPVADRLVQDYPATAGATPLVGPVKRGVAEPAVGCLVSFRQTPGSGQAGLGLGVEGRGCLKVLIDSERQLILDGTDVKAGRQATALPAALRKAIAAHGHQAGLTIRIGRKALVVMVRAGPASGVKAYREDMPLNEAQRKRLLGRPLAVLSRGGRHDLTPYLDVPRPKGPDLGVPAPANRWRNVGDRQLYAVYKAAWRLGSKAPGSLLKLRKVMLAAADRAPAVQRKALAAYRTEVGRVRREVAKCGGAASAVREALKELEEGRSMR
jgi:hypothetical protein